MPLIINNQKALEDTIIRGQLVNTVLLTLTLVVAVTLLIFK